VQYVRANIVRELRYKYEFIGHAIDLLCLAWINRRCGVMWILVELKVFVKDCMLYDLGACRKINGGYKCL
jgi:hypothetical protein